MTWEPFDFGFARPMWRCWRRREDAIRGGVKRTQFDVAVATADAYLTLVAAQETVRAAQAGVDRAEVMVRTIAAQVNAAIAARRRPVAGGSGTGSGADAIDSSPAGRVDVARATLAQFTGGWSRRKWWWIRGGLVQLPPEAGPAALNTGGQSDCDRTERSGRAGASSIARCWSGLTFRGFICRARRLREEQGRNSIGEPIGRIERISAERAGLCARIYGDFSGSRFAVDPCQGGSSRARRSGPRTARAEQIAVDLRAQWNRAVAALGWRSAGDSEYAGAGGSGAKQQLSRLRRGIRRVGNIDEVAEAQRLLTQAEIDDALARLSVWRGLLGDCHSGGGYSALSGRGRENWCATSEAAAQQARR